MLVSLIAIVISVLALASSTYLAFQQGRLLRNANFIPVYADMLTEFRTLAFNDHYYFVTRNLTAECDPNSGITGLPDAARTAVYDVAYYFQNFAALRLSSPPPAQRQPHTTAAYRRDLAAITSTLAASAGTDVADVTVDQLSAQAIRDAFGTFSSSHAKTSITR